MMRRRVACVAALTLVLVVFAWPAAGAKDLGTDVLGNISPSSQVDGGLVDRYPLSAFSLDYHTDVGITELDGVPPTIAQWFAAQVWSVTSFLLKTTIDLFTWAFSLDLLGVDGQAGGALAPVGQAIRSIYDNVLGQPWMVVAFVLAGCWGIWKALVQRRYTDTVGKLATSVVFVVIAMFFVYQPQSTVGTASRWTNDMSVAFLAGANTGSLDDPGQAKRKVADQLFDALIYRPWTVLEFGGLRHCVDVDQRDDDGYPKPVGPRDPKADVCRDNLKQGQDGHGGYAERFLRYPAGSKERDAEFEALQKGETPTFDEHGQFRGYAVDKSDSPAVDVQQEHGAFQRLTLSLLLFFGSLGAVALLGFLSLAVILAQVVALVVLGFAPVALIVGIFPGAGHDFFRNWLGKLGAAIFVKALYSLVIAIVVAVAAALTSSTSSLGFLFAFGLQAIFFWAIFLYRKQITARLVAATTGSHYDEKLPAGVQQAASRPFTALVGYGAGRFGSSRKQESGLDDEQNDKPDEKVTEELRTLPPNDPPPGSGPRSPRPRGPRGPHGPYPSRVAADGVTSREELVFAENGRSAEHDVDVRAVTTRQRRVAMEIEQSPRAAHDDVMRRARDLRDRDRGVLRDLHEEDERSQ